MDINFPYKPICKKMEEFHNSRARYRCITGGFGCGKTYGIIAEAIMLAMEYPNNEIDICRKTFGELDRSTRMTVNEILPKEIISRGYSSGDHQIKLINSSYLQFFPLDEIDKVKSLNAGVIVVDEASEIPERFYRMLQGRLRRNNVPRHCMLIASNPTFTNHWLYKDFGNPDTRGNRFHRSMATYENPMYKDSEYLQDLRYSLTPELYEIYVEGAWGYSSFGERIYPDFGTTLHVGNPMYNPNLPVLRGWDFGYYHPACVFVQIDDRGRVSILAEIMGKTVLLEHFIDQVTKVGEDYFPDAKYEDYGDIAGKHKDARGVSEKNAHQVMKEKGIDLRSRYTLVKDGLALIRRKMGQIIDGSAAILIHKERCPILIEGMSGGYVCKQTREGAILRDEPKEEGYFEHLQDAFRYVMVSKFSVSMKQFNRMKKGLPVYKPAFEGCAW